MSGSRSVTRTVYTASLLAAPLLLAAAMLRDITPDAEGTQELLSLISGQPDAWALGQTLFLLSAVAWLPAGLALMRLFGDRTLFGRWAGLLVMLGGLAILPIDAAGLYLAPLAGSNIPEEQQVALVESVEGSTTLIVFETVHVVALFVGLLVVAVAMLRSRIVPMVAPIAIMVAIVGLLVNLHPVMEFASTVLLVVGLGLAALRVARLTDDEWLGGAIHRGRKGALEASKASV
ncbi:hypothetical protein ACX3O0_05745 [Homoserinimonas sp. A447]